MSSEPWKAFSPRLMSWSACVTPDGEVVLRSNVSPDEPSPTVCIKTAAILLLVVSPIGTAAQTITDGDTLKQGGVTYRLWGIDAPEAKQVCPDGWPAAAWQRPRCRH